MRILVNIFFFIILLQVGQLKAYFYDSIELENSDAIAELFTGDFETTEQKSKRIPKSKSYTCKYKYCAAEPFQTKMELNNHIESTHCGRRCKHCADVLGSTYTLNEHILKFHMYESFESENPDEISELFTVQNESNIQEVNGFDFENTEQKSKRIRKSKLYTCKYKWCTAVPFQTKEELNDHIESTHYGRRCMHCTEVLGSPRTLNEHILNFHMNCGFKCPYCNHLPYNRKSDLLNHINGIHLGIKIECPNCTSTFVHKSSLNKHLKAKHNQ